MAYSGTVGQTVITVQNLIDDGARRAGKLAEELTVEQIQASKQSLFLILSNLINQGIQYFCWQYLRDNFDKKELNFYKNCRYILH